MGKLMVLSESFQPPRRPPAGCVLARNHVIILSHRAIRRVPKEARYGADVQKPNWIL